MSRTFDVEITRNLASEHLGWPEPGEAGWSGEDAGFGGNRCYCDLRGMRWSEVRRVYEYERDLINRITENDDPEEEYLRLEDEQYDDPDGIYGLDLGVASSVVALSAARCVPFSSCNAGAFGGSHNEAYPLVAFYARPAHVDLLLECAQEAECGLDAGRSGSAILYACNIEPLRRFALEAMKRSSAFRKIRLSDRRTNRSRSKVSNETARRQLKLF